MYEFPNFYSTYIYIVLGLLLGTTVLSLWQGISIHTLRQRFLTPFIGSVGFLVLWTGSMSVLIYSRFFATSSLPTGPLTEFVFLAITLPAYFFSRRLKDFILSIPLYWLIVPQIFRMLGGIFIVATYQGFLPKYWGYSVGLGDFLTGLFAPLVVYAVYKKIHNWQKYLLAWSIFGLFDIVHVLVVATLSTPSPFQIFYPQPGIEATQHYPLIIIVAIARPLVILLHIFILAKYFSTLANKQRVSL